MTILSPRCLKLLRLADQHVGIAYLKQKNI